MTHNFKLTLSHTVSDENNVEVEKHQDLSVNAVVTD